jgi:hypothetical protein
MREFPEVREAVGKGVSLWFHRVTANVEVQAELRATEIRLRWVDLVILVVLSLLCALAINHTNQGELIEVRFPGPQVVYFKKIN